MGNDFSIPVCNTRGLHAMYICMYIYMYVLLVIVGENHLVGKFFIFFCIYLWAISSAYYGHKVDAHPILFPIVCMKCHVQ